MQLRKEIAFVSLQEYLPRAVVEGVLASSGGGGLSLASSSQAGLFWKYQWKANLHSVTVFMY